jgi:septal ring factor EnvC (AmiA/AmiB activator)
VDNRAKTLIIEQPIRQGYKLVNQKPAAVTASKNRFEVKLNPVATDKFVLQEERLDEQSYMVSNLNPDFLVSFVQNKALSAEGRKQLETILDRKRVITAMDSDLRQAETDTAEITKDQDRIRQNLGSLNRVAGQEDQVNRYARQLATQESQLATLRDKISELRRKKAVAEAELNRLIAAMEF